MKARLFLVEKINEAIIDISERRRNIIHNLYAGMKSQLCKLQIRKEGYVINRATIKLQKRFAKIKISKKQY